MLNITNTNFIISKRLCHASFKLNIVNVPRTVPPGPPLNPLRGSQCPRPRAAFYFPIYSKQIIFSFLANAVIACNFNGHVGKESITFDTYHGGKGYSTRNPEELTILDPHILQLHILHRLITSWLRDHS